MRTQKNTYDTDTEVELQGECAIMGAARAPLPPTTEPTK